MNDARNSATDVADWIWRAKYRRASSVGVVDSAPIDTFRRVATALAEVYGSRQNAADREFLDVMQSGRFYPAGRILAGAGTRSGACLVNCFVMPSPGPTPADLARAIDEGALTLRAGGGVGYDLTPVCPASTDDPGVVAVLEKLDRMAAGIAVAGERRGAMMGSLSVTHPEAAAFARAKLAAGVLPNFNLSLQVTDAFMREARGHTNGEAGRLWCLIAECAFASAEPGVLFVDRINALNNLRYAERLTTTNPCGETPLPPYGACVLGSLCLPRFVERPFTPDAHLDFAAIAETARTAVAMLDAAIDISAFPLPQQREAARMTRRIGIGVMGLADAIIMLGLRYDSAAARRAAAVVMRHICHSAYRASIDLAKLRGAFPAFDPDRYLDGTFAASLPLRIRDRIRHHGIRNSHLTAIAPTGSISLLAGGVSSGIEPVFAAQYEKPTLDEGAQRSIGVENHAVREWRAFGGHPNDLPPAFAIATDISWRAQIDMQASLQRHVDGAISKTVTLPLQMTPQDVEAVFDYAFDAGVKGCAVYSSRTVRGTAMMAGCGGHRLPAHKRPHA